MKGTRWRLNLLTLLACFFAVSSVPGLAELRPRAFTNLQVLPEDISTVDMFETMKQMTTAIGAECKYCHRTDIRDFASDEMEAKRRAREMMRMVERMNGELSARGTNEVLPISCFTCHQGQRKPTSTAPLDPGISD